MTSISVVIPLFNKERHIGRAIESVLRQTKQVSEIIVVDDGSTDNGAAVAISTGGDRVVLLKQLNSGVSSARNRGIKTASGEFIAFLDADDEWYPHFIEEIRQLIETFPDAGLYATAYELALPPGIRRRAVTAFIPDGPWKGYLPSYFKASAFGKPPVCSSCVCIPEFVFTRTGMFSTGRRMGEDVDMWGRIAMKYRIAFSTRICAVYHHDASDRASDKRFEISDEHPFIESAFRHSDLFNEELFRETGLDAYLDRLMLENARQHALSGNFKRARTIGRNYMTGYFMKRKLLWSSQLNRLARLAWNARYLKISPGAGNV